MIYHNVDSAKYTKRLHFVSAKDELEIMLQQEAGRMTQLINLFIRRKAYISREMNLMMMNLVNLSPIVVMTILAESGGMDQWMICSKRHWKNMEVMIWATWRKRY